VKIIIKMRELSNKERAKLIQRVSNVMRDEFNIFPDDIDSFWKYFFLGIKYEEVSKDARKKVLEGIC